MARVEYHETLLRNAIIMSPSSLLVLMGFAIFTDLAIFYRFAFSLVSIILPVSQNLPVLLVSLFSHMSECFLMGPYVCPCYGIMETKSTKELIS